MRFRALRGETLALKECIAIVSCGLGASLRARTCVQVPCMQETQRSAFALLSPLNL